MVKNMTILAPLNAPNTDGIDPGTEAFFYMWFVVYILSMLYIHAQKIKIIPIKDSKMLLKTADSSTEVCIEDCYIESGDDLVAVKSGWDQYGIAMARPSSNIIVRRISGTTPTCSGVGIGSEMSGGVSNITIDNIHVWRSAAGVRIKTDAGRGGYIANISISNLRLDRVKVPIKFSRGANDHPDEKWDPKAIPKVSNVFISNVVSVNSKRAPEILGIEGSPYEGICMRNVNISGLPTSASWHCEHVSGFASEVFPSPCPQLHVDSLSASCGFS